MKRVPELPGDLRAEHRWTAFDGQRHQAVFRGSAEAVDAWCRARINDIDAKRHRFTVSDPLLPFRYAVDLL